MKDTKPLLHDAAKRRISKDIFRGTIIPIKIIALHAGYPTTFNKVTEQEIGCLNTITIEAPYDIPEAYLCQWDENDNPIGVFGPWVLRHEDDITVQTAQNLKSISFV